jgi:hypothetical protein
MNKLYLFIIFLIFTSCKQREEFIVFELNKNRPYPIGSCKFDTHKTDSVWALINKYPKECIEYLMTFKGQKESAIEYKKGIFGSIGFCYNRTSYFRVNEKRNDVGSLHLICAIFYNNYFFSSDRVLYYNSKVVYDKEEMKFFKYKNKNLKSYESYLNYRNNRNNSIEINKAWQLIEEWWANNKHKSIEEIRKGERPFSNSDLYWYGEQGGKVNKNFPHKYACYDRRELP